MDKQDTLLIGNLVGVTILQEPPIVPGQPRLRLQSSPGQERIKVVTTGCIIQEAVERQQRQQPDWPQVLQITDRQRQTNSIHLMLCTLQINTLIPTRCIDQVLKRRRKLLSVSCVRNSATGPKTVCVNLKMYKGYRRGNRLQMSQLYNFKETK